MDFLLLGDMVCQCWRSLEFLAQLGKIDLYMRFCANQLAKQISYPFANLSPFFLIGFQLMSRDNQPTNQSVFGYL